VSLSDFEDRAAHRSDHATVASFEMGARAEIRCVDMPPVEADDPVPFFEQEYLIDTWLASWLAGTVL